MNSADGEDRPIRYGDEQDARTRVAEQKRRQAFATGVLVLIYVAAFIVWTSVAVTGCFLVFGIITAGIHILTPEWSWLTLEQQSRVTTGVAPALLISNAWLIFYATGRLRNNSDRS